jgi:hypothetical protein
MKSRIVNQGMGGFLCPPGHPMHTHSVETDCNRRPQNRGGMCLESAVDCEWLDAATRSAAMSLLNQWNLPLAEAHEWVLQVLGYFKGCYCRADGVQPEDWHVGNLLIDSRDSMANADHHAGVRCIKRYYPEYQPTAADFAEAHWGTK